MSADADLIKLYSGRILKLATAIPLTEAIADPMATVKRRSPLCGSTITVSLSMQDGVISAYGQDVKACALGQAAAAIVGQVVIGRTAAEIETARDQLKAMLKENAPVPDAPFDGFEVLLPARDYKNRHASIMLAIEATLEAVTEIKNRACA